MSRKNHDRNRTPENFNNKTLAYAGATTTPNDVESILRSMRDEDIMRASARNSDKMRGKRRHK